MLRRLIFILALYFTLDVANPMMPGALVLSAEDSIEMRMAQRLSAEDVAAARADATKSLKPCITFPVVRTTVVVRAARPFRTHAPRHRVPVSAPAASPEEDGARLPA
jgi:hypothetical protein